MASRFRGDEGGAFLCTLGGCHAADTDRGGQETSDRNVQHHGEEEEEEEGAFCVPGVAAMLYANTEGGGQEASGRNVQHREDTEEEEGVGDF